MWALLLLGLTVSSALPVLSEDDNYLNRFLVKVNKRSAIHDLAAEHGFTIADELEELGYHLLEHKDVSRRSKRSAESHENNGQSGGTKYIDLNIKVAWDQGYTGKGVTVTVLDDGIDHTHPDLKKNADMNDKDDKQNDPMPDTRTPGNSHGTRCAGEIAAEANNSVCSVGVAYNAQVGGVRMLDGEV